MRHFLIYTFFTGYRQYIHDTGIHCAVVGSFSMACSKVLIVSSMSLFTIVKSKNGPYEDFSRSDSLIRRSRLPSY